VSSAGDTAIRAGDEALGLPWITERLPSLLRWEAEGLAAAQGDAPVHLGLYPRNILLTADDAFFVDSPHACLGAPLIDPIAVLTSASAGGIDLESVLHRHVPTAKADADR
jgi:hypothetical protein